MQQAVGDDSRVGVYGGSLRRTTTKLRYEKMSMVRLCTVSNMSTVYVRDSQNSREPKLPWDPLIPYSLRLVLQEPSARDEDGVCLYQATRSLTCGRNVLSVAELPWRIVSSGILSRMAEHT